MPEIREVVSESLQATIRRLLPSQKGFTEDLQATNVITPIIDLTPTAEGSSVPANMQTALAYGSQTSYTITNTTQTVVNTAGFYRIDLSANAKAGSAINGSVKMSITDGVTPKDVYENFIIAGATNDTSENYHRFDVFLRAGDSVTVTCGAGSYATVTVRQIANVSGDLINPSGFSPQ